jgi:hypothetical protein
LREAADRQIEGVQSTLEQADRTLNHANQLLGNTSASRAPPPTRAPPDDAEA